MTRFCTICGSQCSSAAAAAQCRQSDLALNHSTALNLAVKLRGFVPATERSELLELITTYVGYVVAGRISWPCDVAEAAGMPQRYLGPKSEAA